MTRIAALEPADTHGKTRATLDAVHRMLGATPNLFRVAAQAPAVLDGLVALSGALSQGSLAARDREAIAITVAEANGCDYCLSAHTALGKRAGLADADLDRARDHTAADPRLAAILAFAHELVVARGRVGEAAVAAAREAGLGDRELLEIIGNVAVNVLTNYINLVAETPIDFPLVRSR
ncbi:MAG TPA: carboxymuconolactone decarboxylase family protein [Kofleriaceae bacterium]|nr:carboxymuconolactone decarboxylase family protein [Kofleriaceae bacterium]